MKKVLILGALAGQVDAVDYLRRRGVETHVCAHERRGPGIDAADFFHQVDITDVAAVTDLARRIGVDVVYSVGSDIAMPTVVRVSEALDLPHFHGSELTDLLRSKEELRGRLAASGLSPVGFVALEPDSPVPDWGVFPCIVKPVDSQGQRGISIVETPEDLPRAIAFARANSVSGKAILEELLVGPEVSAHVLVRDGKVAFFLPSDRHVWDGPMVGVPRAHSLPLRPETAAWESDLRKLVDSIVVELDAQEGPLYVQAILTADGPRIVEIASRMDGCHLWRLIQISTGLDLMDLVLGRLLGDSWPDPIAITRPEPMTLEFFLDSPAIEVSRGYLDAVVSPAAEFVEIQVEDGERPRRTNDVVARIGYQIVPGI